MEFRYRRLFQLPPNDPRFLSLTLEEILTELLTWECVRNPSAADDEDEEFDLAAEVARIEREEEQAEAARAAAAMANPDEWEEV